jgi:VWFA-related protein
MCRRLAALCILATIVHPVWAAKHISVAQLQQIMDAAGEVSRSDAAVAQQLADVSLTERLSPATLTALESKSRGSMTNECLRALADESAFLNPPASEILSRPTPDFGAQKGMMTLVVNYVVHTLPTLPNFMATRVTQHFSDLAEAVQERPEAPLAGFYPLGTVRTPVAFRNGQESDDPALLAAASAKGADRQDAKDAKLIRAATSGLASWGEFGPILSVVLVDAGKGKLGWSRWEQWEGKPAAVFQFSVASAGSHYTLQYWRDANGQIIGSSYRSRPGQEPPKLIRQVSGYSGTLTVDPETGAILRIEIEASLRPDEDLKRAGMIVEYGKVGIGDAAYTCPIHSITVFASMQKVQNTPVAPFRNVEEMQLNDVNFTSYRRFGSEVTLVVGEVSGEFAGKPAGPTESASAVAPPAAAATSAGAMEPSLAAPKPAPAPVPEEDQEMLVTAANGLPGAKDDTAHGVSANPVGSSRFTLKVTTRLVDLGLFATEKHGKPILDLKQDEIEVYDNGRKQSLAGFKRAATPSNPEPSKPQIGTFTNVGSTQDQDAPDLLILLMDESHLPFNDLNLARGQVLSFLKTASPNAHLAFYSIGEHGFRVIQDVTTDRALLQAKLAAWTPNAAAIAQAAALDQRNRQQFDTVRNPDDLAYVNGNETPISDGITSVDPNLRQMGDNPLGQVLLSMIVLARHFGPVAGHKSLAWISGDSALFNFNDQAVGIDGKVDNTGSVLNRTKEALNEAHISLYAIDASKVSVGGPAVDASLYSPSVELNPVSTANSMPGGGGGSSRVGSTGRATAQMQQDTRAIQTSVRLLAEATGGRAINKGSDLKATLAGIEQETAGLYEVAFHPDSAADGKFHTLQVKIPTRKDVKLRYRAEYLYSEETQDTQQRFQQAVWSPQDATAIALTAEVAPAADSSPDSSAIKLRIAFRGLALERKEDRWSDQLYIFVAQRDDVTRKAEISGDTLRLSLKQATYETGMPAGIPYQRAVEVQSMLGSVRVIVVDGNSSKMGSVTLPSSALHP